MVTVAGALTLLVSVPCDLETGPPGRAGSRRREHPEFPEDMFIGDRFRVEV